MKEHNRELPVLTLGGVEVHLTKGTSRGDVRHMAQVTYDSLSEVPEDLQEAAKEAEGGKYVVNVVSADKIKEFRENNIGLSQERDALQGALAQYESVTGVPLPDLEEGKLSDFAKTLEALRDTSKKVADGKLVEETSLEEAAAARVTEVTNNFKDQLASMAKDRDAHKAKADASVQRANAMMVENAVRLAASDPDVAMIDKAVAMIMPNALKTFKVEDDGKIVPKQSDGTILYGSDGVSPKTLKEWLLEQREENDFLFKGSKGGGASGSADKSTGRLSQAELAAMKPAERMKYARANGLA